jgi:hypothetical protein
MTVSLASLILQETKDAIYAGALAVAAAVGLPVTSWQAGDPTRTLLHVEAEKLSVLEAIVANFIASGFLDYATGVWLEILAKQVFNVDVPAATYASTNVVLSNGGGGYYPIDVGSLTLKSSISGKTFHNITGGILASGPATSLTLTFVADEAGSASSAGVGEINTFVTALLGVTCSNAVAALGIDKQDEATTRLQCRNKLGSLSPNGPRDAYSFVALNSALTGTTGITRSRVYGLSTTGKVTQYLAGPAGAISGTDLALVIAAILKWATPFCFTPSLFSASNLSVPVTYTVWIYKSCNKTAAQVQADIQTALLAMLAAQPIGGDVIPPATTGILAASLIESTIKASNPKIFKCVVALPSGDISLTNGQVAALGAITATVNIVVDP